MTALAPAMQDSPLVDKLMQSDYINKIRNLIKTSAEQQDWLATYQWMNSQAYQQQVLDVEWRLFISDDMPQKPSLARLALWDVRNLNMVSHIMRVVARYPGENILVIVGANHKLFIENHLSNMLAVELQQF